MFFGNINYIVVVIAVILSMVLGYVWYAPWAFGRIWTKSKGSIKPNPLAWISIVISTLITALVIAILFNSLFIIEISQIFFTAFLLWVGFSLPLKLNDYLYGRESIEMFLISVGYGLVSIILMMAIIGIFG